MTLDDRFDDLVTSLGGFYRAWVIQLGLELGFFPALRAAGPDGLTSAELAAAAGTSADPTTTWCRAAYASDVVGCDGDRIHLDEVTASILLDEDRPEYLGGQFTYTVTASLDYADLAHHIQTGRTVAVRPPRYYRSIEQLTRQDIAIFFEEVLAALPDMVTQLVQGRRRGRPPLRRWPVAGRCCQPVPCRPPRRRRGRARLDRPRDPAGPGGRARRAHPDRSARGDTDHAS